MSEPEAEFDLGALNDEELTEQVHDDLYNGLKAEVEEATRIFLKRGWSAERVLNDALVEGMRIVGIDFRDGILFVPEVLLAANSMKGGMEILRPLLAETGVEPIGKIVIGTVKGDIHDIGKNLVSMMLEGAGFEVIDLGINNPVDKYLDALEKHKPDILGMSALLTTTMPYMKVVIDTLKERGIRNDYIVLVGGAPLNEEFGKAVGADAYCRDAAVAVETAKGLLAARRAARGGALSAEVSAVAQKAHSRCPEARSPRRLPPGKGMLIIACGALAHEIMALRRANGWDQLDVRCLPAELHNRPERIPAAVRALIHASRCHYRSIFVAYADCGTGGLLDAVLREEGIERIPGAHCYEFFATSSGVRGTGRRRTGHVLPHGLSAAAFRSFGDARSRARSAPGAVPELLRQLSQARLSGAGARTRVASSGPGRSRRAWDWNSNIARRATGRWRRALASA